MIIFLSFAANLALGLYFRNRSRQSLNGVLTSEIFRSRSAPFALIFSVQRTDGFNRESGDAPIRSSCPEKGQREKTSADTARKFIASRLFEVRRYDLANVGRYKINKKLDVVARAVGHTLAEDIVDPKTKKVI